MILALKYKLSLSLSLSLSVVKNGVPETSSCVSSVHYIYINRSKLTPRQLKTLLAKCTLAHTALHNNNRWQEEILTSEFHNTRGYVSAK